MLGESLHDLAASCARAACAAPLSALRVASSSSTCRPQSTRIPHCVADHARRRGPALHRAACERRREAVHGRAAQPPLRDRCGRAHGGCAHARQHLVPRPARDRPRDGHVFAARDCCAPVRAAEAGAHFRLVPGACVGNTGVYILMPSVRVLELSLAGVRAVC